MLGGKKCNVVGVNNRVRVLGFREFVILYQIVNNVVVVAIVVLWLLKVLFDLNSPFINN